MDDLNADGNIVAENDDNNTSDLGTCCKLVWEYELSRGRWIKYDNAISKKLK